MTRTMTPAVEAALQAQMLRPALFMEAEFPSGFVRVWTGVGDVVWNAQTWLGAGALLSVSAIEETTQVVASGVTVSLSGVPVGLVSAAIADARQGMPGRIWVGMLDAAGAIIADPVQAFAGRLDVPTISDGAEVCTISITYESRLINLTRAREWRYTAQSQRAIYPDDAGFDYVAGLQDKEVTWGR